VQAGSQAVMAAAVAPAGVEHLESPEYADRMETVRTNARSLGSLMDYLAVVAGGTVALAGSAVVLARIQPLLLAPVAAAGALGLAHASTRRRSLAYMDESVPGQRLARRFVELGTSAGPAKEVRVLGLGGWVVRHHQELTDAVAQRMVAAEKGPVRLSAVAGAAQSLLLGVGVALVVREAAAGRASAGEVALGVVLLLSTLELAGRMSMAVGSDLSRNTHLARRYLWLLDYQPPVVTPKDPQPVPAALSQGIVLEDVSFTYPGRQETALEGVSLHLAAGSTVALVGDNGAGKSTLVKLLCRFYDPTSGRVTVDGVDLSQLDLASWRAVTTGAFQDFVRFHVLAREAVGLGHLPSIDDPSRVAAAAAAGGAALFLEGLPLGFESQLGRQFDGGTELSEGQWQKVALSRGLMRVEPLLVVLDEPTAALDARAEHLLFERYAAEAAAARRRGAITVLVSHRFSTVRMADLIVVLDQGRIIEKGTHLELVAANGRYAELFGLQARGYA
jgi:ATP-binding cassette, subfamily B, bacterial